MDGIQSPEFMSEQYATAAMKRWGPMLEGLGDDYDRAMVATLLDNQKVVNENATTSDQVQAFTRLSFPLIRRIYPGLVANDLISIQPMRMPTAKIFYLDFTYNSNLAPISKGDRNDYQVDQGTTINQATGYTRGFVRGAVVGTGDASAVEFQLPAPADSPYLESTFTPVRDNSNLQVFVDASPVTVVISGTPGSGEVLVDPQTGALTFNTAPANAAAITANYDLKFEGDDSRIPEMSLGMSSDAVAAETRKLKVRWTIEAQQDMLAYHGLNAESELVQHAGDEIAREIDREIIADLVAAANGNVNWSKGGFGASDYTSVKDYEETLIHAILDADKEIYKKRLVRSNWIITGPDVAARLQKINSFRFSGDFANGGAIQEGPHVFGTLSERWRIIVDPMFEADKLLVGYKGGQFFRTGYVLAPYQGLMVTDRFMDPNDFTPRRGMMRRDARKVVSGDFYVTVTLTA